MSPPSQLPNGSGPDGSGFSGALPYLGAVITGLLGFFGARFTGAAQQWAALSGAFSSLMGELQTDRARLIARISDLEATVQSRDAEIKQLRGEIRGLQQLVDSLRRLCAKSGLALPPESS